MSEENKEPESQGTSKPEVAPAEAAAIQAASEAAPSPIPAKEEAKVEQAEEKNKKVELDPSKAARDAIFEVIRESEMSSDEKISAIAPLLRTLQENRPPAPQHQQDASIDMSPQAHKRWSMIEGPIPMTNRKRE